MEANTRCNSTRIGSSNSIGIQSSSSGNSSRESSLNDKHRKNISPFTQLHLIRTLSLCLSPSFSHNLLSVSLHHSASQQAQSILQIAITCMSPSENGFSIDLVFMATKVDQEQAGAGLSSLSSLSVFRSLYSILYPLLPMVWSWVCIVCLCVCVCVSNFPIPRFVKRCTCLWLWLCVYMYVKPVQHNVMHSQQKVL